MRGALAVMLCACGAATTPAPVATPVSPAPAPGAAKSTPQTGVPGVAVDVIAQLGKSPTESSWLVPGPAQLVLGGPSLQAIEGAPILEVELVEERGSDVRVGVRLEHARFAVWTTRARLLAVMARDQRVVAGDSFGMDAAEVVVKAGAQVRRIARKNGQTQIRYVGAIEAEGWVPDEVLADRGAAGRSVAGRIPTGRKTLMLSPGAIIRSEPRWAARQLAVMNQGYFVDTVKPVDDAWVEVAYEDGDVKLHGFVSKRDPPGRTHRRPATEPAASVLTTNSAVRDHACLYAGGQPIGFVLADRQAAVERSDRSGWWSISLDSPWGPIVFDARGPTENDLETCGL